MRQQMTTQELAAVDDDILYGVRDWLARPAAVPCIDGSVGWGVSS